MTTTLESLTDGFFTVDRDWRVTYVNREAERLFRIPRAELLGNHIWAKFPIAANGKEALAALDEARSGGFDLILMDVQMPDMGGFEATGIIRVGEKSGGTYLPIIAMTAHAMKGDKERCLAAGMDGYVSKPIQVEQLFSAIDDVLL